MYKKQQQYTCISEYSDIFANVINNTYTKLPSGDKSIVDNLCSNIETNKKGKVFRGVGEKSYRELLVKLYVFLAKKTPKYKKVVSDYQTAKNQIASK